MPTTSPILIRPTPMAGVAAARAAADDGEGLAGALLGYLVVVVLVITLAPFDFRWPESPRVWLSEWTPLDLAANVLMFVPLGFLYRQVRTAGGDGRPAARDAMGAALLGLALSTTVEAVQLLVPERYTSPWDVLTNAAGAWLGAAVHARLARRLDPTTLVGRLGLELPLIGLVYLLVPLAWLGALTAGGDGRDWLSLLCLGLFGASVLGAVQQRHFGPAGVFSPAGMGLAAAAWFALCTLPALGRHAGAVVPSVLLVGTFTWHRAAAPAAARDRRFELAALARAAPFFAAFLLLLPLTEPPADAMLRRAFILRTLETTAAFTLLGYMTAEAWGRRELAFRHTAVQAALAAVAAALVMAALRSGGVPAAGDLPRVTVAVAAAVYGGWLYHLQRARVRSLVRG